MLKIASVGKKNIQGRNLQCLELPDIGNYFGIKY